jgi:predicted nucleotidyltransferase
MRITRHTLREEQRRDIVKEITAVVSGEREIVFAFLHGSFLDGSFFRDIDLGIFVKGIESADFWDYEARLCQQIEEALNHLYVVELKVINKAPLSFCYHVIKGQILFVRDEGSLTEFMARVARSYLDMAPIRHRYMIEAMS